MSLHAVHIGRVLTDLNVRPFSYSRRIGQFTGIGQPSAARRREPLILRVPACAQFRLAEIRLTDE
jgi:hypothetical protein